MIIDAILKEFELLQERLLSSGTATREGMAIKRAFLEKSLKKVEEESKKVCQECGYDPKANHECN